MEATMFPQLSTMSWQQRIRSNMETAVYKHKSENLAENLSKQH